MEGREYIPMSESEKVWVRGFLSQSLATKHKDLPSVDTWLVEGYDNGYVEIFEVVGTSAVPLGDGFPFDDWGTFEEVVSRLKSEGFPIDEFE